MPFKEKTGQFARRQMDETKELGRAIGNIIVRHPKKCIAFLVVEGWVHGLVAHHIKEAKDLMGALNPF